MKRWGENEAGVMQEYPGGPWVRWSDVKEMTEQYETFTAIGAAERRLFIRQAAIAIYVQGMMVPDHAPGVITFQPNTCWRAAAELWAAKPEDC